MKPFISIVVLIIGFNLAKAQTEIIPLETSGLGFDSTYLFISEHSYLTLQIDTLEFNDGYKAYRYIEKIMYRPDTTIRSNTSSYRFQTDTFSSTLIYPVYFRKYKKLRTPVVDTIWDPLDLFKFSIQKTDSIEIDFALSYDLDPITFFQTIREIERMAEFQELSVATISIRFYPSKNYGRTLETIRPGDFHDVDFISTIFLFEKDGVLMDYPIIFE